ncbi:sensor histidine kinase [Silvanigrella aquatica]|uniref:histidine kinase n=1 Tax=Silvanigrella aquatica TaxID=1915309 RepID=A0A1L4CZL1_9BACT|nr:HAMP domain-containing sensor histidine kinase [Silvanigrella aquatica]APJ03378.1 hypothetical protein AXG55_05435 [Silvanigrella aquatica]
MTKKKLLKFRKSIFIFTFSLFCSVFIVYTFISYFLVKTTLEDSFKDKILVSQNLFADSIHNDILTGFYSEVFRKCKIFYESGGLDFINVTDSSGSKICDFKKENIRNSNLGLITSNTYFDEEKKISAATISANYSDLGMRKVLNDCLFIIVFALVFIALLLSVFINYLSRYFALPVQKISQLLRKASVNEIASSHNHFKSNFEEIVYLNHSVAEMAKKIVESHNAQLQQKEIEAVAKIAAQVVHDIRSPLSALNVYVKCVTQLPEEERVFIRTAVDRINDIANNLVHKFKNEMVQKKKEPGYEIVSTLLENIVAEKRVMHSDKKIKFDLHIAPNAYMEFIKVNMVEFQSVISNLMNNAVEAMGNSGVIKLILENRNEYLWLTLIDSGCGMSPEFLQKAIAGGMTTKTHGVGIGLSSSVRIIQNWNCKVDIQSQVNEGTTISIQMPIISAPNWFPQEIKLSPKSTLVIIDDDQSIHDILMRRFASLIKSSDDIQIVNFKDPQKFIEFYNQYDKTRDIYFLFDYEFIGSNLTGTDIINQFNLGEKSTLITSYFEDTHVRNKCSHLGIKVIPKNLAYYIPIQIKLCS